MHVYTIGTRLEPVVCGAAPAGDARELPYVEILTKKEAFEAADEEDRSLLERIKEMAETQTWRTPGAGAFFGDFLEHIIGGTRFLSRSWRTGWLSWRIRCCPGIMPILTM